MPIFASAGLCTTSRKGIHPVPNGAASPSVRTYILDYKADMSFASDHRGDKDLLAVEFVALMPGIWVVRRHIQPRSRQLVCLKVAI
jgi:hypothetical protein